MCWSCIHFIETVIAGSPIHDSPTRGVIHDSGPRLGEPLTTDEKIEWFCTRLPLTASVMDLAGLIRAAERQPAHIP